MGIWVEESDALPEGCQNGFVWKGKHYPAELLCDIMHLEGAMCEARYETDFYAGSPVLSRNSFGKGAAWYVAARSSREFYEDLVKQLIKDGGVEATWTLLYVIGGALPMILIGMYLIQGTNRILVEREMQAEVYEKYHRLYQKLYQTMKEDFGELAKL